MRAWAESLGGISYPLLSDFWPHGAVAKKYGVLRKEGHTERAIFIIDKDGIIRYIDIHDIDEQPNNEVLLEELRKILPESDKKIGELYEKEHVTPEGNVIMYCTPWCHHCREARAWLADHGIAYTEVDISKDLSAARQVRIWGHGFQITPTFDIQGKIVVDYDLKKLTEYLLEKE